MERRVLDNGLGFSALVAGALILLGPGCRTTNEMIVSITAPSARFPISLTHALLDENGLVADSRLRAPRTFEISPSGCFDRTQAFDISAMVNKQVAELAGDAVIDLKTWTKLEDKDCLKIRVTGTVVKVVAVPSGDAGQ